MWDLFDGYKSYLGFMGWGLMGLLGVVFPDYVMWCDLVATNVMLPLAGVGMAHKYHKANGL